MAGAGREQAEERSEAEWLAELGEERYAILRQAATEPPFSGTYLDNHEPGLYRCGACGEPLFRSNAKFESGSGWPSFYEPVSKEAVEEEVDLSHGMRRVEARCASCGSHLGHVFPDGPQPTGERYCINSLSLDFEEE